jgi:integrase
MATDITFAEQSKIWLRELEERKRKPVSPATLRTFGAYLRTLVPMIGDTHLASVNNSTAKSVVATLCERGLSPKTVNEMLAALKSVVASAIDPVTGEQLFPLTWNAKYIDAPTIGAQHQPCLSRKELEDCIKNAHSDQEKLFYSLLAGTGLRVSEALSIHIAGNQDQTSWDRENSSIHVRTSVYRSKEQARLKTPSARRTVDLDPQLNSLIAQFVAANKLPAGSFLFQSRTGHSMYVVTATARMAKHGECAKGFHAFRRFRITHLREFGVPEDILRFWAGHSGKGITDTYSKLSENTELRQQWAGRCGVGFDLPKLTVTARIDSPCIAKSKITRTVLKPPAITGDALPYQASDEDLPTMLFETPTESVGQP